jgi:hypothetical protein
VRREQTSPDLAVAFLFIMSLTDIDIDLLALVDELTTQKGRLFGQVLQAVPTSRGGWGILLVRDSGRLYFQGRDCPGGLPTRGALVSFEPCPTSENRPARDIQVLAVPEARK